MNRSLSRIQRTSETLCECGSKIGNVFVWECVCMLAYLTLKYMLSCVYMQMVWTANRLGEQTPALHWVSCLTTAWTAGHVCSSSLQCTPSSDGVRPASAWRRCIFCYGLSCFPSYCLTGRSTTREFCSCPGATTSVKW